MTMTICLCHGGLCESVSVAHGPWDGIPLFWHAFRLIVTKLRAARMQKCLQNAWAQAQKWHRIAPGPHAKLSYKCTQVR